MFKLFLLDSPGQPIYNNEVKNLLLTIVILFLPSAYSELTYADRDHSKTEIFLDQALMFSFHTIGYIATQGGVIEEEGSMENYKKHFFEFHFDPDNKAWNYVGHPLTGSQVYLFYRAKGYRKIDSFYLSFLSSLYFEVFIETYTERPSIQDTFHTPILGSALGYFFENASLRLIGSESIYARFLGRVINPFSLFFDQPNANNPPEAAMSPIDCQGQFCGLQFAMSF